MHNKIISHIARPLRPNPPKPTILQHASLHYDISQETEEELPPPEWYRAAYAQLIKLTHLLNRVEHIDGRLIHALEKSTITDSRTITQMRSFHSLVKSFIGSPFMSSILGPHFSTQGERSSMTVNSLTTVSDFLNISAQQRQNVRLTVCPQVTQHHIWRGALEEVLDNLKQEMETLICQSPSPSLQMGQQILSSCIKFFSHAATLPNSESPSWMRPAPLKKVEAPSVPSKTWEEFLEMFVDLTKCLEGEELLAVHVAKLEVMKEGLYQIRDIVAERDISYKDVRRQDCLVQRKLSRSLGHSSRCLFTLLLYYLYGTVWDIEVELCGGVRGRDGQSCLHIGKILTSCDEEMVRNGIRQLNRALGIFEFVWETAAKAGKLELQGHLWCVGAEERRIKFRGNVFFVHGIGPL